MSEPREVFIQNLMTNIMRLTMIPKVQVERAIGPILGLFIADLLSTHWTQALGRPVKVEMICEEFPLLKAPLKGVPTCQSTNIDWLLYNVTDDELVFLELKTADTSFDPLQEDLYLRRIMKICESGSLFLLRDLEAIRDGSLERKKYEEVLKCIDDERYKKCGKAKLVYLAPAASHPKSPKPGVEWMSFEDLPKNVSGDLDVEWGFIRRELVKLDNMTRHSRNGTLEGGDRRNFGGTCRFEEMVRRCEESGNTIIVGFKGGARKLRIATLDELNNRPAFKWDHTESGTGAKDMRNWIPGQKFLEIVEGLTDDVTAELND
jgi:hypothetical protein